MPHIQGIRREESLLLPPSLEEILDPNSVAWVVEKFVNKLDLAKLGFLRVKSAHTGRPSYAPWVLLKLLLYGMLEEAESSRRMEKETYRNIEVMWLVEMQHPDFKTIADFRRQNAGAIERACQEFLLTCAAMGLLGKKTVAIDGSKFKAVNALRRSFTKEHLQKRIQEIGTKVQKYLQQLEEADRQEEEVLVERVSLQEKIQGMQEYHQRCQKLLAEMEAQGAKQVCLTDSDSRIMKEQGKAQPCYNVQTVVDSKHHLIVTQAVTQDCEDRNQLAPMAQAAQEVLGVTSLEVIADKGYYHGEQIAACEEAGMTCYIPPPEEADSEKTDIYPKSAFVYNADTDSYTCPGKATLTYERTETTQGRQRRIYQTSACKTCSLKRQCSKARAGRKMYQTPYEPWKEILRQRQKKHPEKALLRRCLVEHPFGTLKRSLRHRQILMRGLPQVRMEISLRVLAYNIKRVKQILGVPQFLAQIHGIPLLQSVKDGFLRLINLPSPFFARILSFASF